ncbi:PDR/VanB family oxidoreductase [Nocardia alba]|uniref:Ferredoxin-NADP reductase n=1 Tax=Nocardia alba TaxID=225051 RepID=A0A4R1FR98_9NOCA|nr:PDR/VanB family oxidoreductase [Nocardia alba]TCJ97437.1 ferredoxin-NADP reductase [Nocardia alba]
MTVYPAPRVIPPDLYGKHDHDPTTKVIDTVAALRVRWSTLINRRPIRTRADDARFPVIVTDRVLVAQDQAVVDLGLRAPDGAALPRWAPGAHIDIELPSGRLRQYSLCGDPAETEEYRIAVRRIPQGSGGSIEVHDELPVGSEVMIRGPRNAFPFAPPGRGSSAKRLHFVAGGIGITPILAMARAADRLGIDWTLVYCGRSRETLPFLDQLAELRGHVLVRTDDEHGTPRATDLLDGADHDTAIYCCGPAPMTSALVAAVRTMPGIEFHSERFSPAPVVDGTAFEVELTSTGEVIAVGADQTMLDALLAVRPDQPYSCRQGFCRTCVVRVTDGTPDHRDGALTPAEHAAGVTLACVSRCAGKRLVLDL